MPQALLVGSIALAALVLFAFWPGYISKPPRAIDGYTHFHAAIAALWLSLLVVQPLLIARRRLELHRLLGRASWVLAPLFVLSALLLAHFRFARMDDRAFDDEAYTLYLPLSAALLFAVAYALAIAYRRNAALHARLLACTALLLVDPVCGRVLALHVVELPQFWHYQLLTFAFEIVVVLVLAGTLAPASGPRRVFSRFALFYISVLVSWFIAARTPAWYAFADWYRKLPLT